MAEPAPLVRVVRSGLEESVHAGHVAVCDAEGRLLAHAGDPQRGLYARSSLKPLQAAASLSAIGDGEDLGDAEIALMCASHNGEPLHVDAVRGILDRAGLDFTSLRCPPSWPIDPEAMASAGTKRRELHNCSGKHAGKLLAAVRTEWDTETYLDPAHPLQRRILDAVRLGIGGEPLKVGVDGCGAPVHAMRLLDMATLFARLAVPDRYGDLGADVARATSAMAAQPYMVAGRDRVDTAVMQVAPNVAVKAGAEGLLCAAVLDQGIGVAVKVQDGGARGVDPVLIRILLDLDVLGRSQVEQLARYAKPVVFGGGQPVGAIEPTVTLDRR